MAGVITSRKRPQMPFSHMLLHGRQVALTTTSSVADGGRTAVYGAPLAKVIGPVLPRTVLISCSKTCSRVVSWAPQKTHLRAISLNLACSLDLARRSAVEMVP